MKLFLFFSLLYSSLSLYSQINRASQEVIVDLRTMNYSASINTLQSFIQTNNVYIERQSESGSQSIITLLFSDSIYKKFETLLPQLGYLSSKNVKTVNIGERVKDLELEIAYLQSQKASYESLLLKLEQNQESYLQIWKELKEIEEKIFQKQKLAQSKHYDYKVEVNLYDDLVNSSKSKVSFVNMPGVEYSILMVESPLEGLTSEMYQGLFLKYLFTQGKSYAHLGAYKSIDAPIDTTTYSEMFVMSFGQDFYSRYLGRGNNKSFNLYSSYSIGNIYASGKTTRKNYAFISPSIGVELFKNKYVLFDTKVTYFLPLSQQNRHMRGVGFHASCNFVF